MGGSSYRELIAWQKAMDFVESVYAVTASFPSDERFGLTQQLRKSAVSIPSNIAEGHGRHSNADFRRFLTIAHGSLSEAETQLDIARRLGYLDSVQAKELFDAAAEIGRVINGLRKSRSTD